MSSNCALIEQIWYDMIWVWVIELNVWWLIYIELLYSMKGIFSSDRDNNQTN